MTEQNNSLQELATMDDAGDSVDMAIEDMVSGAARLYTSLQGDDFDTKIANYEALTNSTRLRQELGVEFNLEHVIVQRVDVLNEETGEVNAAPRVILIDDEGNARHGVSTGLLSSLKSLFGIAGQPQNWPEPIRVRVVEKESRRGFRFMTIEVVRKKK